MKNLLFWLLLLWSIALMWCNESNNEKYTLDSKEWFNVVKWYCEDEWWRIEDWKKWEGYQSVCFYEEDESYCFLEDLYNGLCNKWELYDFDENVSLEGDLYPYAEQACIDSNGQVSQNENGKYICVFDDSQFCYVDEVVDWTCDFLKNDDQDEIVHEEQNVEYDDNDCYYIQGQIRVCGKDASTFE